MNRQRLHEANETLHQGDRTKSNRILWVIIGAVAGLGFILAVIAYYWFTTSSTGSESPFTNPGSPMGGSPSGGPDTYPYIPVPRNIVRSISLPELVANFMMDVNESAVDYSVISREQILKHW